MKIRAAGFFEVTGLTLVHRVVSANVCTISYEEHTPEPWTAALMSSNMTAGAAAPMARGAVASGGSSALRARLHGAASPSTEGRPVTGSVPTGRHTPPPPPPPKAARRIVELGEPLLPERANDPKYYPGLVEDLPVEWAAGKPWGRWALYAGGALALFGAGLAVRGASSTPTTWSAIVDVTPVEAQVSVDGEPLAGTTNPRTKSGLIRGDHVLTVMHPGYEPHRQVFRVTEGDQRIVVTLERETPKEPPPEEPVQPMAADGSGASDSSGLDALLSPKELAKKRRAEARAERAERARERRERRKDDRASESASASSGSKSSGGTGILKLNSMPWSEVYIDKKRVGNTPILGMPLPAGRHTIKLSNPQLGVQKTLRIKIKAGETVTKVEKLGG